MKNWLSEASRSPIFYRLSFLTTFSLHFHCSSHMNYFFVYSHCSKFVTLIRLVSSTVYFVFGSTGMCCLFSCVTYDRWLSVWVCRWCRCVNVQLNTYLILIFPLFALSSCVPLADSHFLRSRPFVCDQYIARLAQGQSDMHTDAHECLILVPQFTRRSVYLLVCPSIYFR